MRSRENHDWYDVLTGFMIRFCDNQFYRKKRNKRTVDETKLRDMRAIRRNETYQPNMYFCLDTASLRIVCVDTGIRTHIDDDQMAWLRRVSATEKRKILITGDPIYANGKYDRRLAELDRIVKNYGYLAVIGGDTRNYQQYRVSVTAAGPVRDVWHFVNGGGGWPFRSACIENIDQQLCFNPALKPKGFEIRTPNRVCEGSLRLPGGSMKMNRNGNPCGSDTRAVAAHGVPLKNWKFAATNTSILGICRTAWARNMCVRSLERLPSAKIKSFGSRPALPKLPR